MHLPSPPGSLCLSVFSPGSSVASVTVWPEYLAETANAKVLLQDTLWRAGLGGLDSPLPISAGGSHLPRTTSPCEPSRSWASSPFQPVLLVLSLLRDLKHSTPNPPSRGSNQALFHRIAGCALLWCGLEDPEENR